MPWTWDWAGTTLRLRQALSALASGRARPASCPGVPHVTLASAGGQDPPLIGCAAKARPGTLTVSLTNNRSLTMVMSVVPADATPGPASYTGAAAFLTDHAFREAFARRLGSAILPPTETIPYSVPLHGPPEDFSASITNRSKLLDLALLAGEEGLGGITHQYLTCLLNTVLRTQVPSVADLPGLATDCLPVLAATIPTLKTIAKGLGKKPFFRVVGLVTLDIKLALLGGDKALDQFRGIHPQVRIDRPAVVVVSAPCTSAALTTALDGQVNQPGGWKVLSFACQSGYSFASVNPVTGGMQAVAILQQQGSVWKVLYSGEGLCLPPGQNQSMCQGYKQPMPIGLLESLMRQAGYLH
jgi:hypothetical protein